MFDWNTIAAWELKSGSHDFPGPNGGTCINEAAIIAAGFEYKEVNSANDCPPCFSRPISAYAIVINDAMPDNLRQELLLPFVTRLAGSADTPEIERQRQEFMIIQIARRLISTRLIALGDGDQSKAWASAQTVEDVRKAAVALARALDRALGLDRALDRAVALDRALAVALDLDRALAVALDLDLDRALAVGLDRALAVALDLDRARALALDLDLALAVALDLDRALDLDLDRALDRDRDHRAFWTAATEILDGALKIGNQQEIETTEAIAKLTAARQAVTA